MKRVSKLYRILSLALITVLIAAGSIYSPVPAAAQMGNGLKGEYYDNIDFTNLKLSRTDTTVNFNWGTGSPDAAIGSETFSVRWTGQIRPQYSQKYCFYINFNGGVRLWVDGELLIDKWFDQTAAEWKSFIDLAANTDYDIRLDYYTNTGDASVKLYWSSSSQSKQIIPQNRMSETPPLISLNKPATAQSYETGHHASLGNDSDGSNSSYWSGYPYTQWWQVDLGANYDIRSVNIRNYIDGTRYYHYNIQTSINGTNWTTVATKSNNNVATDVGDTYSVSSTGRYVRVNMTYNSANRGCHISNLRVYGYKECTLNQILLTSGKTATVETKDSTPGDPIETYAQAGHGPEYAIDAETGNSNYTSIYPYQHFWQVDLEDNYDIRQIKIRNYVDGTRYYQYAVYVSEDLFNWIKVGEKNNILPASDSGDVYHTSTIGRYIRIMGTYNSVNEVFHLTDVKAYGFRECVPVPENAANPSAFSIIQSEDYDGVNSISFVSSPDSKHEYCIGNDSDAASATTAGDYLRFDNLNFGSTGASQFIARVHTPNADAGQPQETVNLEIRLDSPTGTLVGTLPAFKQWQRNSTLACDITNVTGVHTVFLRIGNSNQKGLGINWFQFVKKSDLPAPAPKPAPLTPPAVYNVYFGNLHSHTAFSDGAGVPDTAFNYARNTGGLDFLGVTEHSNLYDNGISWDKSLEWRDIIVSADRKTVDGSFVGIAGSETTWYPSNGFGHMNTYAMEFFINTYETKYNTVSNYYDLIKQYPASINQWNHPWDADFNGFSPYDADVDNVLYLMEVPCFTNATDYMGYYVDALDKGWHIAPTGNQDNHQANWGTMDTRRTAVLTESLSRDQIFDAIRNYRVYSTTDVNMKIIYKINNSIMGSTLNNPSTLNFSISAIDPNSGDNISRIEVYTEGRQMVGSADFNANNVNWTTFSISNNTKKYYFLKVIQGDGQFAITAPIWTGK